MTSYAGVKASSDRYLESLHVERNTKQSLQNVISVFNLPLGKSLKPFLNLPEIGTICKGTLSTKGNLQIKKVVFRNRSIFAKIFIVFLE